MVMAGKYYLIYSENVAEQIEKFTEHPLLLAENIQIKPVKLIEFEAIHIDQTLQQVLLWVNQADYPKALSIASKKRLWSVFYRSLAIPSVSFIKVLACLIIWMIV